MSHTQITTPYENPSKARTALMYIALRWLASEDGSTASKSKKENIMFQVQQILDDLKRHEK